MDRLTDDLLELCMAQGGAEDLALAGAVSTGWRTLANDPQHWTRVVLARWPHLLVLPDTCLRQLYRMLARPNEVGMLVGAQPIFANPWAFLSSLQLLVEFEAEGPAPHRLCATFAAVLSLNDAELVPRQGESLSQPSTLQWDCPDLRILAKTKGDGWMKSLALWSGQDQQMLQLIRPEDDAHYDTRSGGGGDYYGLRNLTPDANVENDEFVGPSGLSALQDLVVSLALTGADRFTAAHPNYNAGLVDEGEDRENAEFYRNRPCIELYLDIDPDREHFNVCFQSPWYMHSGPYWSPMDIPWHVLPELSKLLAWDE